MDLDLFSRFLHSETELSRVTDRLTERTDTAITCNNSLHLVHSMQPKNL